MKPNFGIIIAWLPLLLLCAPYSSNGASPVTKHELDNEQAILKKKMQGLYSSLTELLTDVSSNDRYYNPKNAARIEKEIKDFNSQSQDLHQNAKDKIHTDPTLKLHSTLLMQDSHEAYRSFKSGYKDYARDILRSVPNNCIACHSRNPKGQDFSSLPLEPSAPLSLVDKAEFYAATRQFDRAIETFQKVFQGSKEATASVNAFELQKLIKDALMIAVRFKRDPVLAKNILQSLMDNPTVPEFLKENAGAWKKSVESWEQEGSRKLTSPEGIYTEIQRLLASAKSSQEYPLDHTADILYLRASSLLYDLIQADPEGKHVGEALLLLGICYEVLTPRGMEVLNNIYYSACIRHSPHSALARTCYRRYEESTVVGFTGSSGTHLPNEVRTKLQDLKALASEKKEVK